MIFDVTPKTQQETKSAQCSLCLGCSVKNKAKDPSSHICLVQHKSVWKRKRKKSVFVALERRSHCSVKGKHFADDGNTEEYC